MTETKVELLSPAGDPEKFRVALEYGADAVYGGVSHFSLRIRSGKEFDLESFGEAIEYAHARGKKVYATVNGFPFNSQLGLVEKHLAALAELKPDAFIVSTPGVIKLAKKIAPDIGIHLSTQANVLNYMDAEAYADMGITRIIAARECSMKDLEGIKKHLPNLEIEIFVHGSMCFAYSGRCLVSSLQMGRGGAGRIGGGRGGCGLCRYGRWRWCAAARGRRPARRTGAAHRATRSGPAGSRRRFAASAHRTASRR